MIYYRLRQTDFDGGFEYSPIVSADFRNLGGLVNLKFFPNPTRQGITSLYFTEAPEAEGILEVFDPLGSKVFHQKLQLGNGGQPVPVDLSSQLPGIYTARLELGGEVWMERLVVVR